MKLQLIGQKFGKLTVISNTDSMNYHSCWVCLCECGKKVKVKGIHLKSGHTKSCGCLRKIIAREKRSSKNNYAWKGENASYKVKHLWVARWLGKPDTCEFCGKSGLLGHAIHWANKSGKYLRNLDDWIRLCVSCHKQFDFKTKFT